MKKTFIKKKKQEEIRVKWCNEHGKDQYRFSSANQSYTNVIQPDILVDRYVDI